MNDKTFIIFGIPYDTWGAFFGFVSFAWLLYDHLERPLRPHQI